MSRHYRLRLLDITDAIDRIVSYTEGLNYHSFLEDIKTQDAVTRNIEIIGEASRSLPEDFRQVNSTVPWQEIIGMRNVIVHAYFGILPDVVWDIIKNELAPLKEKITQLLADSDI